MAARGKKQKKEPAGMNCAEIFAALALLEKERNIPQSFMMDKIIQALTTAYKRDHSDVENVIVDVDEEHQTLKMYVQKNVVDEEDYVDPPLQLSQQKSMAKMSAFQPMLLDIQNKYKDKPEKQQEEMLKLQQDYGYSPTAGCVPMLLNFLVMFGVIGVVYNPLERIFHISAAALTAAGEALTASGVTFTAITRDTTIISQLIAGGNSALAGCFTAEQIATITEFSQHMTFLGIDLTRVPKIGLSLDIVLPLLSVITMFLSTHISMKASGQQMQGSMKLTMYMMPLMYLFFCFTYPLAFSLYYVISNIVMTVQTQIMRKVYDPEKMRKEVEAQIAEKRKQEKRGVKNTTVKVTDPKTGKVTEKNLSASEMNKHRLEYARQLDAERYKDERTVPLSELNKQDKK